MAKTNALRTIIYIGILFIISTPSFRAMAADEIVTQDIQKEIATQENLIRSEPVEYAKDEPEAPVELEKDKSIDVPIQGPSFVLREIKIEGSTLFTRADFKEYLDRYIGKEVSFADLRDLTLLITNHYRSRGYATSRAYIPTQKMQGGSVTIQVIEGKVGKIIVEGNKWFPTKSYERSLMLREGEIFKVQNLETGLRRVNASTDRFAKAYLIAGEKPLTSDVILKAKDRFPIHGGYEFNNRGSKLTHRARHEMFLSHSNLLGFGDSLAVNLTLAEQYALLGSAFNYRFPIYSTKTFFTLDASITQTQLAKHLREFKIKGKSWSLTPGIQQTFFENRRLTLSGNIAFEIKDSKTAIDEEKISFDRVRVLKAGPKVEIRDSTGRTGLGTEVHWGVPKIFGASDKHDINASRDGTGGEFVYFTGSASRVQKMPFKTLLMSRLSAQYSPLNLISLEQFRAGGVFSVRGYPEGDTAGDSGFSMSNELRIPPAFIPKSWNIPKTKKSLRDAFSLIGFIDGAYVNFHKRSRPETEKDRILLGAGYGLRFNFDRYTSLLFDMGFPFGDESTDKDNPQIHFSIRTQY